MPQNTWFQGLKLLFPRLETLVSPWGNFGSISRKLKFLGFGTKCFKPWKQEFLSMKQGLLLIKMTVCYRLFSKIKR